MEEKRDLCCWSYWRKRFADDFELVSCDWRTSDTGEKKIQSRCNDILEEDIDCLDMSDSKFTGIADMSDREDELKYTIVFIDKYTKIKYTVTCGFYAGEVEFETDNQSYISKWDTPEGPTEIGWDEDIEYDISGSWGSKYYDKAMDEDCTETLPRYSILSMSAEACEGSKYSPKEFNNMTDAEKENWLNYLKVRVYSKDKAIIEPIMDYYFYNLIFWKRHTTI